MDYNARMNYEELSGKSILLLGKTRSLNPDEFLTLLKLHNITLNTRWEEETALIIEGRLMNPLEQQESARLYEANGAPIEAIEGIEEWLCRSIEPNRLLMSLKLSNDQERLVDFLQNPYISDELFFKLLKLYNWQDEGLFDNDSNRDVTASIIGRFYKDLERNHNVQYAMSGLAHLIERYGNRELIEAISALQPVKKELQTPQERSLNGVLDAIAIHPDTSEPLLALLIRTRPLVLAQRVPLSLETELIALNDEALNRLLVRNPSLSAKGIEHFESLYPEAIAEHMTLDEERFGRLIGSHATALASNATISRTMQKKLYEIGSETVNRALAANPAVESELLSALYAQKEFDPQLASNPSLPQPLIEELYRKGEGDILSALAANPSTPVEILYQLSLDQRFERFVKTNPAFGRHIQTHNIGWQV